MNRISKCCLILAGVVAGGLLPALSASAQGLGRRYELAELQKMVTDAQLLVRAKATAEPVSKGGNESGYVWQTPMEIIEVVKGEYAGKEIVLWLKSPTSDLDTSRSKMPDKEFVLPLVAMAGEARTEFCLVDNVGFAADRPEADTLLRIAGGNAAPPPEASEQPLRLRIDPVSPPYEVGQAAPVRITLENTSTDLVAYEQAPFEVRDGRLYILGDGNLIVTDTRRSMAVAMAETVHLKTAPPLPATPISLIGGGTYAREVDLAEFFDLSQPGLFRLTMALVGPDGKTLIRSNTASLQVIAPLTAPADLPATQKTTADSLLIPSPEAYRPGEIQNGLAGLLRPAKAQFEVGEPILVELRLVNVSDRTFSVDTRLERVLVLAVKEQGDSPPALRMLQHIDWPKADRDGEAAGGAHAYLRPLAFWGKELNVNSLYGRDEDSLVLSGKSAVAGATEPTFETHGMTLFAFEKPGVYKVRATYQMAPSGGDGPRLWAGKLETNPIFIRVVKREESGPTTPGVPD